MRNTPSFKGLEPASKYSSKAMQGNRNSDTKPEVILRKTLWKLGLRYRKNVTSLPGKPDIAFPKEKVVIFCDGDFWHGRNWDTKKLRLAQGHNAQYWIQKIEGNIDRDKRRTAELTEMGWHVIRLWESDVLQNPEDYANMIRDVVLNRRADFLSDT